MTIKELNNLRDRFWRKFTKAPHSYQVSNAIQEYYKRNKEKIFKGRNGFIFIKNEVFASNNELFMDLYNSIYHLL